MVFLWFSLVNLQIAAALEAHGSPGVLHCQDRCQGCAMGKGWGTWKLKKTSGTSEESGSETEETAETEENLKKVDQKLTLNQCNKCDLYNNEHTGMSVV